MMIRFDDGSGDLPEQREIPTPLVTLLPVLGPQRMNQVQEMAYELCEREDFAAVELVCMAEMVRTYAETLVWRDERQGAPLRARSIPPWNPPAQSEEHSPIPQPAKLRSASQPTSPPRDRVPYVGELGMEGTGFTDLTKQAIALASSAEVDEQYGRLLRLLSDCEESFDEDSPVQRAQLVGASYKQLAYICHLAGIEDRRGFYDVAESIPLSQRHAGHLIMRLKEEEEA